MYTSRHLEKLLSFAWTPFLIAWKCSLCVKRVNLLQRCHPRTYLRCTSSARLFLSLLMEHYFLLPHSEVEFLVQEKLRAFCTKLDQEYVPQNM